MKLTPGQRQFASGVAEALTRAFTERLHLHVEVAGYGGKGTAYLLDGTGRTVWSQTAEGAQLELFLAAPQQPAAPSPGAPADAPAAPAPTTPSAEPPSPVLLVECPADPSLHPQDWADDLDLSFFPEGLVRWEMSRVENRPGKEGEGEGTAWTFVPRAVANRIWERLAETGARATLTDADPDGEVMLLVEGGSVSVRGEPWRAHDISRTRSTITSAAGESREVETSDVRWIAGGFCCVAPPPKEPKAKAKKPAAKKASKKATPPREPVRLWIAEATWDALGQDERDAFSEYAEWQGTEGYVFADVPAGEKLLAVRELANELDAHLMDYAPRPELAKVTPKKKPAKPAKGKGLHKHEAVPEADALPQRGVCTLVRQGPDRWEVVAVRAKETGPEWRALALGAQRHGRVRVYDRSPRCTWDSLDEAEEGDAP